MKKLLIICILMVSILFISGCTSDEQASSDISTSSQSNQESDTQNPELIIKQSDVPGLTLAGYHYFAVPKSTPDYSIDYLNIDEVNETNLLQIFWLPVTGKMNSQNYNNVLPLGTRNIGQYSIWRDESGREVEVELIKFDSSNSFHKYYAEAWDVLVDYANQNPQSFSDSSMISLDDINNKVDLSIGDYSFYNSKQNQYNADIQETSLVMLIGNNYVTIMVKDEASESVNKAIRIAKKIESRLD